MCIIKPFRVQRAPFLRDVGFLTLAVSILLVTVLDGRIFVWEARTFIALYVVYVFVVVAGSWWDRRQERKRHLEENIRNEYADDIPANVPLLDDPYADDRKAHLTQEFYSLSA